MTTVFLLRDLQHNYLNREDQWAPITDGKVLKSALYHTSMRDEAINQKVECIVKNPDLRIQLQEAQLDSTGKILLKNNEQTHA